MLVGVGENVVLYFIFTVASRFVWPTVGSRHESRLVYGRTGRSRRERTTVGPYVCIGSRPTVENLLDCIS